MCINVDFWFLSQEQSIKKFSQKGQIAESQSSVLLHNRHGKHLSFKKITSLEWQDKAASLRDIEVLAQRVAACCSVLHRVAFWCSVLQRVAPAVSWLFFASSCDVSCVLQCAAVRCSVLRCVAVCCSRLQCAAVRCNMLHLLSPRSSLRLLVTFHVCCSVLQRIAARCIVMQRVAACCSMLHLVSPRFFSHPLVTLHVSALPRRPKHYVCCSVLQWLARHTQSPHSWIQKQFSSPIFLASLVSCHFPTNVYKHEYIYTYTYVYVYSVSP